MPVSPPRYCRHPTAPTSRSARATGRPSGGRTRPSPGERRPLARVCRGGEPVAYRDGAWSSGVPAAGLARQASSCHHRMIEPSTGGSTPPPAKKLSCSHHRDNGSSRRCRERRQSSATASACRSSPIRWGLSAPLSGESVTQVDTTTCS